MIILNNTNHSSREPPTIAISGIYNTNNFTRSILAKLYHVFGYRAKLILAKNRIRIVFIGS